ncbi:unnamed protein product [Pleuronectes platessa]|uniref:Uncharacterized protein n=1 Tax=Pleuronectes platessa TaxID=8262 RepID=A0A9N7YN55_PLEPL|nr:unnamed protein product [Pleuronectes platessa]
MRLGRTGKACLPLRLNSSTRSWSARSVWPPGVLLLAARTSPSDVDPSRRVELLYGRCRRIRNDRTWSSELKLLIALGLEPLCPALRPHHDREQRGGERGAAPALPEHHVHPADDIQGK